MLSLGSLRLRECARIVRAAGVGGCVLPPPHVFSRPLTHLLKVWYPHASSGSADRTWSSDSLPLGQRVQPKTCSGLLDVTDHPRTQGGEWLDPIACSGRACCVLCLPLTVGLRWRARRPVACGHVQPAQELCWALTVVFFLVLLESVADVFSCHELSQGSPVSWHLRSLT